MFLRQSLRLRLVGAPRGRTVSWGNSRGKKAAASCTAPVLARRGMQDITPTSDEFRRRYSRESKFRNLVQDIEEVEKRIVDATAPTEALRQIVSEMFIGGKES